MSAQTTQFLFNELPTIPWRGLLIKGVTPMFEQVMATDPVWLAQAVADATVNMAEFQAAILPDDLDIYTPILRVGGVWLVKFTEKPETIARREALAEATKPGPASQMIKALVIIGAIVMLAVLYKS